MISESTLNALDPFVNMLYADRVAVMPLPSSVLGVAVAASKSAAFELGESSKESFIDKWLSDLAYEPTGLNEPTVVDGQTIIPQTVHGRTIDVGANAIFEATTRVAQFVREHVVKQTNECINRINALIADAYRPVEEWEIIEAQFLPIWNHPSVRMIVESCNMGDGMLPNLHSGRDYAIPTPPAENAPIADYLISGQKSLEKAFFEALRRCDLTVDSLYASVFGAGGRVGPNRHAIEMRNVALCQLLLVYMLEDNPWPGCGLSKVEWEHTFSTLKNALSKSVAIYAGSGHQNEEIGLLIQDIDYKTHRIYVEANVYNTWLDESEANTPEIIIGLAMLKESGVYSAAQARDMAGSALRAWQGYHNSKQQSVESNRLSVMRSSILSVLTEQLQNTDANCLPPGKLRPAIAQELGDVCRKLTSVDGQDLGMLLVRLICKHFYPHTGCYEFAMRFNQIASSEPNATADDWELKAVIEYITDFISAQIVVGRT